MVELIEQLQRRDLFAQALNQTMILDDLRDLSCKELDDLRRHRCGRQTISGAVAGHGAEIFHLTEPGDLTVHISSAEGEDWTTRTVKPPGVQTVTTSRLEILRKGDTIRAERVLVYPGPANVLQDTIEALGRYPFG